jgi:hypothetical protein
MKNFLFRVDTKRIQLKANINFVNFNQANQQIKSKRKPFKSNKNLSMAILGMIKSYIQNEIPSIFSKATQYTG